MVGQVIIRTNTAVFHQSILKIRKHERLKSKPVFNFGKQNLLFNWHGQLPNYTTETMDKSATGTNSIAAIMKHTGD